MDTVFRRAVRGGFHLIGLEVHRGRTPSEEITSDQTSPESEVSEESPRHSLTGVLTQAKRAGLKPGTVIDVGAAFGTPPLYQVYPEARHLLVEPLAEWESVLHDICRDYQAEYVLAAAASRAGTRVINVYPYILGSSLLQAADGGVAREIPTIRLDEYCTAKQYPGPYVIKVDAEGAELDVLAGATKILDQTELVILEISLFEFFAGCPLLAEIVAYMRERNFLVYDLVDVHYRPLDGAVAKLDLAFAPSRGVLRRHSHWGQAAAEEQQRDAWLYERLGASASRKAV